MWCMFCMIGSTSSGQVANGLSKPHPEFPTRDETKLHISNIAFKKMMRRTQDMVLYRCWVEDAEETEDLNQHSTRHTHTMGVGADDPATSGSTPNTDGTAKGKGKGKKGQQNGPNAGQAKQKATKAKTPQQLAKSASWFNQLARGNWNHFQ